MDLLKLLQELGSVQCVDVESTCMIWRPAEGCDMVQRELASALCYQTGLLLSPAPLRPPEKKDKDHSTRVNVETNWRI